MSDFLFKVGLSLIVIEKKIVAAEKLTLGGGVITIQNWLASDHSGAYKGMPHPFFGAKDVCYIEKRWLNKKLLLARRACTM